MNAPTFDTHSFLCPVCRRPYLGNSPQLLQGLLVCQHCRERLVISWSGHYVRDPFTLRQLASTRTLRRDSHPFFRILRDLRSPKLTFFGAILVGALFLGLLSSLVEHHAPDREGQTLPTTEELHSDR